MGLQIATGLNRWVKSAEAKTLHAGRLDIGPRLILGFVFIILSMLVADAVILWQFHMIRIQAGRLNDVDQKLVAVLRVHTRMLAFHDRLDGLADAEDADQLLIEAGSLRTAVLEDIHRATNAVSLPPFDPRRDPTILPTLHVIQSALPSELEAITTLATSGDWRAVHLRLANQVRPLESLTSELVEKVDHEVGEEQVQTVLNIQRVQRLVFAVVPLTAVFTLLIATILGLGITRSITQPLERLVEGSKALARGEFQHQVSVTGKDELAHLGQVFNDTAWRLRDLYATLQRSEDRLRLVIDTIPAYAWSSWPDGSVDFINQRFLEFTGRSIEDMLGWGWGSVVHPDDLTRFAGQWQAAVATGEPMESEARVRRMDGDYRWLLIRNVPLRDEPGSIVNWYGTAIDIEERKRAEETLRRSEAYLAEAQRLSHTGSLGWRPAIGEITWSEETFRIFQYHRSIKPTVELFLQRVHPEDAVLVKKTIERASQDGKDFDFEHRLLMPDGSVKHVHIVAHAEREESGELEFVGAVMDTTDRKLVEKNLRRSEESLLEAQKLSHTGSWRHDVLSGEVTVSPEIYRIHDIKPDDDPSKMEFFFSRFHPEDRNRVVDLFERSEIEKTEFQVDYRIVLPDGTIKHLHTIGRPVLNESGDLVEFVGTAIDVTAAKQAEEALRRSESYLAEAQGLTHTGSWAWQVARRDALHLSEEWYRLYGFDPEKGPPTWEQRLQRTHPEDRAKWQGVIDRAIAETSDYEAEFRILLPDGAVKYIHTVGHPVLNASGDLTEFVGSSTDITERKRAEEERERLRQAQADLARVSRVTTMGELTASLAHEVNQPIAAAVTSANSCFRWLAADVPNLDKARAAAERIVKDGTRAAEIIGRIRRLFQKGTQQWELVGMNEVILEMVSLLQAEATRYSISVRTELAADLPPVMGDRVQLQQLLMNLMTNSIEAMKAVDGTRELAIQSQRVEDEQLLVTVSDTGVGLPPGQADQIFNAFFTTKPHGTGMGLRICRSIVESHGGRLWAADNSACGADFCLTLPAKLEAPA